MSDDDRRDTRKNTPDADDGEPRRSTGNAPVVFLFGAVLFLVGVGAFAADIVTGHSVVRSTAANAAGALVLVGWAAHDTLSNPDSSVDTPAGAVGTALVLYGAYLLLAGVVVGATSVRHGRFRLAVLLGGGAVVAVLVGLLTFLLSALVADTESDADAGGP